MQVGFGEKKASSAMARNISKAKCDEGEHHGRGSET